MGKTTNILPSLTTYSGLIYLLFCLLGNWPAFEDISGFEEAPPCCFFVPSAAAFLAPCLSQASLAINKPGLCDLVDNMSFVFIWPFCLLDRAF